MSQVKIAKNLMVSKSFVCRLIQKYKESGNIKPTKPISTRPRKVDYEQARKLIDENPDKTLGSRQL